MHVGLAFGPNDRVISIQSIVTSWRTAVPIGTKGVVLSDHGDTCDVNFPGYGIATKVLYAALILDTESESFV